MKFRISCPHWLGSIVYERLIDWCGYIGLSLGNLFFQLFWAWKWFEFKMVYFIFLSFPYEPNRVRNWRNEMKIEIMAYIINVTTILFSWWAISNWYIQENKLKILNLVLVYCVCVHDSVGVCCFCNQAQVVNAYCYWLSYHTYYYRLISVRIFFPFSLRSITCWKLKDSNSPFDILQQIFRN